MQADQSEGLSNQVLPAGKSLIIFDGVCNFCNGSVNFIINRDPDGVFVFAPTQSEFAQQMMDKHLIDAVGFDTFVLIKRDRAYIASAAALEITKDLSGYWHLLRVFNVIPQSWRDAVYRLFAQNRYRLFGRSAVCMVPTAEVRQRFIGS